MSDLSPVMFGAATAFVATSAYRRDTAARLGAWLLAAGWLTCIVATMVLSAEECRALGILLDTFEGGLFMLLYGFALRNWTILVTFIFMVQLAAHQNYEEGPATLARRWELALYLDVTYAAQLVVAYAGPRAHEFASLVQSLRGRLGLGRRAGRMVAHVVPRKDP